MEQFFFFLLHYGVPISVLTFALRYNPCSKFALFVSLSFWCGLIGFLFLWGQYPLVGSYYIRYLLLSIIALGVVITVKKYSTTTRLFPNKKLKYLYLIPTGVFSIFLITLCIKLYQGSFLPENSINLSFPLKNGAFYIANGGSNNLVNNHFRNYPNSQQYALDIYRLKGLGAISENVLSTVNSKHFIYSDTVYCPCSGTVIKYANNIDDNQTSSMSVNTKNGKGNFVTIDCDGVIVSVYHLKKNSVFVELKDAIAVGKPIGLVGNSGFSQEPHLHLQAFIYDSDSTQNGIPISFEGEYLSRNDLIKN